MCMYLHIFVHVLRIVIVTEIQKMEVTTINNQ